MNETTEKDTESTTGSSVPDWITALFRDIDSMDADAFLEYLTDDAVFIYGSGKPVTGKESIRVFLGAFYSNLAAIRHLIIGVWQMDEAIFIQTKCTYSMKDDREITIPALNLFNMKGNLIKDYLIYADPTPMLVG